MKCVVRPCSTMIYAQSIKESKLSRMARNLKRSGSNEQRQPRFKKRAPNNDGPSAPMVKFEKGSGSQNGKPTCATGGKRHSRECLICNGKCFHCGRDVKKVRGCPTIASIRKEGKQVTPSVSGQ